MAKSKIVQVNQKIQEKVVGGYRKIEDKFVDQYLTREGESVADAKERLRKEREQREQKKDAR